LVSAAAALLTGLLTGLLLASPSEAAADPAADPAAASAALGPLPPDAAEACAPLAAARQAIDARIDALTAEAAAPNATTLRAVTLPALRALVTDLDALNNDAFPRCKAALLALPPTSSAASALAARLYLPHVQSLARLRAQTLALDLSDQPLRPIAAALTDAIHDQARICATELDPTQCADLRRVAAALPPLPPAPAP
jgi:hypothetical protein